MKLHGKKLEGANVEVVAIPRQSGDLIFKAKAVLDYEPFDKLYPMPTPPEVMRPGGLRTFNTEDPRYNEAMNKWAQSKFHWMFITALRETDGLEWETVDYADPTTWENYQSELREAGLAPAEVARIQKAVTDACGLNQAKIDEATERFLAGQAQALAAGSSQDSAQNTTPSGTPVSASA